MFLSKNLSTHYSNLLLCGFMGAGKTCLLKRLQRTGPPQIRYTDLDQVILEKSGYKTLLKMMKTLGEEHFRRMENELLLELLKQGGHVLALGGGAINEEFNHILSKRRDTLLIWMDTPFEQCLANLRKNHKTVRPLATKGRVFLQNLYQNRQKIYSVAQVRIHYTQSFPLKTYSQLIKEIERQLLR